MDTASGVEAGSAPARTYDDLNDDEKTYALSLARSMATVDLGGMQAAGDAATAAGLSDAQKAEVANIVQYQSTPAIGDVVNLAQSQIWGNEDGTVGPARTYDDLNDDEKTYALSLARSMATVDLGGMQAAGDAATAAGLSDTQKAQVANIVQYQDAPAIGEVVRQVQSQLGITQDGAATPARTYDDLNDDEKTYALSLARSMATVDLGGMQAAGDAATAAGLSDAQKAQVAYIVQDQMTPAPSDASGSSGGAGFWGGGGGGVTGGGPAPTFSESGFPEAASGGGPAAVDTTMDDVGAGPTPPSPMDTASGVEAGSAPARTYDDLNDDEKTYALSLARSMATVHLGGMQAAGDAATAAGLSDAQKAEVANIVQYQSTPAIGDVVNLAQSQIWGNEDGTVGPARTYDDLNDDEKTYALSLARSMATVDLGGMQAAGDAATAAGLSDTQKAQVANIVQYQDAPAIGEVVRQVQSQLGITQDGAATPARTYDDLNDDEKTYALSLARSMATVDLGGMQAAGDAATAAGLSDAQKAQVAYIVQDQMTPAPSDASGSSGGAGFWGGGGGGVTGGGPAPTFSESGFPEAASGGGPAAVDTTMDDVGAGPTPPSPMDTAVRSRSRICAG